MKKITCDICGGECVKSTSGPQVWSKLLSKRVYDDLKQFGYDLDRDCFNCLSLIIRIFKESKGSLQNFVIHINSLERRSQKLKNHTSTSDKFEKERDWAGHLADIERKRQQEEEQEATEQLLDIYNTQQKEEEAFEAQKANQDAEKAFRAENRWWRP